MDTLQRYTGSLCGLAAGDALGTTLEFRAPGTFEPLTDMIGGGPFRLKPGEWTDDTSMALCLAKSLIACEGANLTDQLERYTRWYREGYLSSTGQCFDIGNTVRKALSAFEQSRNPYSGPSDTWSAGNGSIMRLAPVPLFYAHDPPEAIRQSGESSRTTHGNRLAVDACRYFGGLLAGAVNGISKTQLLSGAYRSNGRLWRDTELAPEIYEIASGSFKHRKPPEIRGSGYVVQSLEAALWAFYSSENFETGGLMAVNLGDDADTTGAVYGQLAGACYGFADIPERWLQKLAMRPLIEQFAEKIYGLSREVNSH